MPHRSVLLAALAGAALLALALPVRAEAPAKMSTAEEMAKQDPFLWLEEVEGEKALSWAGQQNEATFGRLQKDPRYEGIRAHAEKIFTARDRIPYGSITGTLVDNFWQDATHVRGIWRRTSLDSYRTDSPAWETILDVDALAAQEGRNWVNKGGSCLPPALTRCLVHLSDGGKDAVVVREYDAAARKFVENGFVLPEAKQSAEWVDENTLVIATDTGPDSVTTSGYPRRVKLWKRGTPVEKATLVFEGAREDMGTWPSVHHRPEGTTVLLSRRPDFFTEEWHQVAADGKASRLNLPLGVDLRGVMNGQLLLLLRDDWAVGGTTHPKGTLVAVPLAGLDRAAPKVVTALVTPNERAAIEEVSVGRDAVYVAKLEDVTGKLLKLVPGADGWSSAEVALPPNGSLSIVSTDNWSNNVLVNFSSFLQPSTLYLMADGGAPEGIKALPPRFDASPYVTEQRFATSKDGTRVPYFVIRGKDMKFDGNNPTLLYGYGGFEIPMTPSYVGPGTISWLQAGGVRVIANIRGGGEYGPRWHQAALKGNRNKAFEDFFAVAEDLVANKITRPERLGAMGGSNGGLLAGVALTQRPDLFNAVVIAVPLLDMLRYHTLLAGASWIGEYGNPEIPDDRAFIQTYSPYQNLAKDRTYPEAFVFTSTKDDRVHPGHARKLVAKLQSYGHPVLYYENMEGGHSAAANLKQRALNEAMVVVYLMQKLMD